MKDYPATTLPVLRYACAVHTIETIFEANGNRLFSSLMRMAGDADPAYDILQESVTPVSYTHLTLPTIYSV